MFSTLGQLTDDLVNALLDDVELVPEWRQAFLHAEFRDAGDQVESLAEAFVVRAEPAPQRPPLMLLQSPVMTALEALYRAHRDAGMGFAQLELTVTAPDGRYSLQFSNEPSLRLAGEQDAAAATRLADRYAELLLES